MAAAPRRESTRESQDAPRIRVGVIGIGVMGSNHARVLAELPGVELVALADPDRKVAGRVAELLGTKAVNGHKELIAAGVDAVTIAAPTHLHHRDRARLHRRAAATCWSKSRSPPRSRRGAPSSPRRGARAVTLMVGHVERFNPAVEAIKDAIAGEDILSIAITRVGPFPPRMSNVGVVIDLAVHDIDLIRWFTESDIVEVQPQLASAVAAARGHRAAAIPHRLGRARAYQHQLADAVQGAHRARRDPKQIRDRRSAHAPGHRVLRLPRPDGSYSMRHLSVGHSEPLRAELMRFVEAIRSGEKPAGHRRGGGREPGDRDPLPRTASQQVAAHPAARRVAG